MSEVYRNLPGVKLNAERSSGGFSPFSKKIRGERRRTQKRGTNSFSLRGKNHRMGKKIRGPNALAEKVENFRNCCAFFFRVQGEVIARKSEKKGKKGKKGLNRTVSPL